MVPLAVGDGPHLDGEAECGAEVIRSAEVAQTARIAAFERHVNGLWGVFIVSVLSAVFLAGFAFLPNWY